MRLQLTPDERSVIRSAVHDYRAEVVATANLAKARGTSDNLLQILQNAAAICSNLLERLE